MKLVWKGIYKSEEQLPVADLPPNAVKYVEPDGPDQLARAAVKFLIPVVIFTAVAIAMKIFFGGDFTLFQLVNPVGIILSFAMIIPHEFLHGISFPRGAEAEIWASPKKFIAFVISTYPVTKWRFIYISALPNLIFGVLPVIIWIFLPRNISGFWTGALFSMGVWSLTMGAGDFLNIYNTLVQVPKGGMTQLSGFNSYWYMP